jgi:hypothetical protein
LLQGVVAWDDQATELCSFDTAEDFLLFWKHAPKIAQVRAAAGRGVFRGRA